MNKNLFTLLGLAVVILLLSASPALAITDTANGHTFYGVAIGVGFGAAGTLIGAGLGFGRIGSAALESMARQPDPTVMNRLFTTMLLIGALLEGATFFSLIVCLLIIVL